MANEREGDGRRQRHSSGTQRGADTTGSDGGHPSVCDLRAYPIAVSLAVVGGARGELDRVAPPLHSSSCPGSVSSVGPVRTAATESHSRVAAKVAFPLVLGRAGIASLDCSCGCGDELLCLFP